jgi:ParB family transcriptional regulator, chromosome partitioning protein
MKPKGLGRGLGALLDTDEPERPAPGETLAKVAIDQLERGKYQPRTRMDAESLDELAASIRSQGLMQPILVRPLNGRDGRYEIIAGERRWRAARLAGLTEVPVVIREVPDKAALSMALIENIQREDLNPLEEAQGLQRLANEFGLTHQDIANAVGRSRTAVTNALRLLNLSPRVQELLGEGKLDMGHARALLALEGRLQEETAEKVVARGLSVRETEEWVHELLHPLEAASAAAHAKQGAKQDPDVRRYAEQISERLGTEVELKPGRKGSGKLIISYTNPDHLETLLSRLR